MICQEIADRKIENHRNDQILEKIRLLMANYTLKSWFWAGLKASNIPSLLTSSIFFANISILIVNDNGNNARIGTGNVNRNTSRCS